MSTQFFEVKVKVKGIPFEYYSRYGKYISHEVIKMFHFQRRTQEQAIEEGKRYGDVISCCKVKAEDSLKSIEALELNQDTVYDQGNPYQSAMAMDSMIWKKRNKRRENLHKDKESC